MENKFNLTREQNVFIAKRNIVDYIWKSANLKGIGVTYPETQANYDGGIVNGLTVDKKLAINNSKYAWKFILENKNIDYYYKSIVSYSQIKRVAILFANRIMIDNGCGIITIAQENQEACYEKLIKYYESGNMQEIKQ